MEIVSLNLLKSLKSLRFSAADLDQPLFVCALDARRRDLLGNIFCSKTHMPRRNDKY